jgi:putative transcription factor
MQCELCGRECDCRVATVDGVRMRLCPSCMRYGTGVKASSETSTSIKSPVLNKIKRPKVKDVYKNMDKELVSGWNDLIKSARKKKGLTREELGFKIGERTVTIAKIENGDLRPSDKVVAKLEKELNINLVEEVSSVTSVTTGSHHSNHLTLGDLIKKEDK